jgi:hypothetical protein
MPCADPVLGTPALRAGLWFALPRPTRIAALWLLILALIAPAAQAQCNLHQTARLLGTPGACGLSGCRAGYAVAVSGDGNTALVGAYGDNISSGSASVFIRVGTSWVRQGPALVPTGGTGTNQYFGCAVALSADGNTALIGAYGDASSLGAAYVFTRSAGVWTQQGSKLVPVGIVGALGYFGFSVALSADGNTALIGADGDNGYAGAAYVFARDGGVWSMSGGKLTDIDGIGVVRHFGSSIAISGDGTTVAVGAYADNNFIGAVYFFLRTGNTWTRQGGKFVATIGVSIPQYFGSSVALSYDGNTALVGAYGDNNFTGAAYNYNRFGPYWLEQQKFLPVGAAGAGRYGTSVAITADGNTAIIGAEADNSYFGAAYICTRPLPLGGWGQYVPKIVASGGTGAGSLGHSVAISASGNAALVGAFTDNAALGSAIILDRSSLCPADFNCSGTIQAQDIFDYLNAWFALDPRADFNGIGGVTVQDIFDYLNAWFAGC